MYIPLTLGLVLCDLLNDRFTSEIEVAPRVVHRRVCRSTVVIECPGNTEWARPVMVFMTPFPPPS